MSEPFKVTRGEDGYLHLEAEVPEAWLAGLVEDDIGDDIEACDEILAALEDVRSGRSAHWVKAWNLTRLELLPDIARTRLALNVDPNPEHELPLDVVEAVVRATRDASRVDDEH